MTTSRQRWITISLRISALAALLVAGLGLPMLAAAATATNASVTLTSGDGAAVGQTLQLATTVTNNTASSIDVIFVYVTIGQSAKLVAPLPAPDACGRARSGGINTYFSCQVGPLAPGASATVPFAVQPATAGYLDVSTSASSYGNNYGSTGLQIAVAPAPADVQLSGSASTGSPARGANFYYTFQVRNGSGQPAYGVTFTDQLPASATFVAAGTDNSAPCSASAGTVTCQLGDIPGGTTVRVTVGVTAPTTPLTFTNTGSAAATNGDTQPNNNSVSVTVQVK